jgi:hypothetical protein
MTTVRLAPTATARGLEGERYVALAESLQRLGYDVRLEPPPDGDAERRGLPDVAQAAGDVAVYRGDHLDDAAVHGRQLSLDTNKAV